MDMTATIRLAKGIAFVLLSSMVMVTASERVYWYLGGATLETLVLTPVFYLIPVLAALWALGSGPSSRLHQVILGGAIFGFVVEGVLTAVIYQDGPFPVLAALFVGWHGLLSVVGFWYLTRRWLLDGARTKLAVGSALVGAYWGIWSIVYSLPAALTDFDEPYVVMDPVNFAVYALTIGAVFAVAHWLLGYVWPEQFKPGKWGRRGIVALCLGYAAFAVLPAVVWAPIKFAVLVGGTLWLLRKSREKTSNEPSAITALRGKVRLRDLVLLMLMPLVAIATYSGMWALQLPDGALQFIYASFSGMQVVAGFIAFIWAARETLRSRSAQAVVLENNTAAV